MTVATFAAAQLLRVLPRTRITRVLGRLCDARLPPRVSHAVVGLYSRAYSVQLDEARPNGNYDSFDAFFTRELRDGARPLFADERAVLSPTDGRVEAIGAVAIDGTFSIKGRRYRAPELLGDGQDARRYQGGHFAVVYLSPRDYHRVHAPVTGDITLVRSLPGELYPVNAIGERHVRGLFARNRRVAIVIDTKTHARITVVMVGAMIVGRITVTGIDDRDVALGIHRVSPGRRVERGEEIGIFHLGSTAVVFAEPGVGDLWDWPRGPVRMGDPLARPATSERGARS